MTPPFERIWRTSLQQPDPQGWRSKQLFETLWDMKLIATAGSGAPDRVTVGAVSWDGRTFQMLDRALEASTISRVPFEVFNLDACLSLEAIQAYLPGLSLPYQAPLCGVWRDGELAMTATGAEACDMVLRTLKAHLG